MISEQNKMKPEKRHTAQASLETLIIISALLGFLGICAGAAGDISENAKHALEKNSAKELAAKIESDFKILRILGNNSARKYQKPKNIAFAEKNGTCTIILPATEFEILLNTQIKCPQQSLQAQNEIILRKTNGVFTLS